MKKILYSLEIIAVLGFLIYYFFVREKYLNNLHAKLDLNAFSEDIDGIEKMLNWYYHTYHIPAISASVVVDGKVVKYISRGEFSKQNQNSVDENSYYQIASTSKMFTGIICKSLELKGKLDLEKSITHFLKDKLTKPTQEKFKDITLRQVMNHRSGLGRSMYAYAEKDILKALTEVDFEFEPDTKHQYSNFGYALITLILEQETNKTYGELLKEFVSDKYDLQEMEAYVNKVPPNQLVTPYWKDFRLLEGATIDFGLQVGGGGVFTNTKTLTNLMVKQMEDYQYFDSLKSISPLILTYPKAKMGNDNFYGYGFFEFNYKMDGIPDIVHTNLEHGGDADGFACVYDYYPKYKTGIVVLTSSGGKWLNQMTWNMNAILVKKHFKKD